MNKIKETFIIGFALFSMFFGAGNLILPPSLGKNAGDTWFLVTIGFFLTAIIIPFLGILAHAKLQGSMYDFGKKVSPIFSYFYCVIVYLIAVVLPAPRTASVTHEMAVAPYFEIDSIITSLTYFSLVFIFALNRSKVLELLGKFLTPLIILILLTIIFIGILNPPEYMLDSKLVTPFVNGILEGYQTFDAIGAIIVGGVLVISINFKKKASFKSKQLIIIKAGFIAGVGLLIIYAGLIFNGALFNSTFKEEATRSEILSSLSMQTLGNIGTSLLGILVALACFTTAVGIITGTADYFKSLFKNSSKAYFITALIGSILGVVMGQLDVQKIIVFATPTLRLIYPITIMLIILNVLPTKNISSMNFKIVTIITFIFSLPDFLQFFNKNILTSITNIIPFANNHLGWVLPAFISLALVSIYEYLQHKKRLT